MLLSFYIVLFYCNKSENFSNASYQILVTYNYFKSSFHGHWHCSTWQMKWDYLHYRTTLEFVFNCLIIIIIARNLRCWQADTGFSLSVVVGGMNRKWKIIKCLNFEMSSSWKLEGLPLVCGYLIWHNFLHVVLSWYNCLTCMLSLQFSL